MKKESKDFIIASAFQQTKILIAAIVFINTIDKKRSFGVNSIHMGRGRLESLAEYGRALDVEPPVGEIKEKAFMIYNLRRRCHIAGTSESDWLLAEKALRANLWVDYVLSVDPKTGYQTESIEQQVIKLAQAIRAKQTTGSEYDSAENWILAARMIESRTPTGKIIVDHSILSF